MQALVVPSLQPITYPSSFPTDFPSSIPSQRPSLIPTLEPSNFPSAGPTSTPSSPSSQPSCSPTSQPSKSPSLQPTRQPARRPSSNPSENPSQQPTLCPKINPSRQPTIFPTKQPFSSPSKQPYLGPSAQPSQLPRRKPSKQPSAQPLLSPTHQPSRVPSRQPLVKPSKKPISSSPSSYPTVSPSKFPTTSAPTIIGQTHKPIFQPSSFPTVNALGYLKDVTYESYLQLPLSFNSSASEFNFGNFFYKDSVINGTCSSWNYFIETTLAVPNSVLTYTSLSMIFSSTDFSLGDYDNFNATCNDKGSVNSLMKSLQTGLPVDVNCGDNLWRSFTCFQQNIICVNCKKSCSSSGSCPGNSYILNPCTSSCASQKSVSTFLSVGYENANLYPQFSSKPTVYFNGPVISVSVALTDAGNIFCDAFDKSITVTSVSQIRNSGASTFINTAGIVTLNLTNTFLPSTTYFVYCNTDNFGMNVMPLSVSLSNKVMVNTSCCKFIRFVSKVRYLARYTTDVTDEQLLSFELSSVPLSALKVSATIRQYSCATQLELSTQLPTILPSQFFFSATSLSTVGDFVVRGNPGCYTVNVTSYSKDDSYTNTSTSIVILNPAAATVIITAPSLFNATISNLGDSMIVNFDVLTDRGATQVVNYDSVFNCTLLLSFTGSSTSFCQWLSDTTLLVKNQAGGRQLFPGDTVILLPRKIKNACILSTCTQFPYNVQNGVIVGAPTDPVTVVVSISSPRIISLCNDLTLDGTGSTGRAGRDWVSVFWTVTGDVSASAIAEYLNSNYATTNSPALIPSSMLTATVYTFSLELQNYLSINGFSTVTVQVVKSLAAPVVSIYGNPIQDIFSIQSLQLYSDVIISRCGFNYTLSAQDIVWRVYKGPSYVPNLRSTSVDFHSFTLPAYSLMPATTYTVTVTASYANTPSTTFRSSSSSISVQVKVAGIRAVIIGGSSQTKISSSNVIVNASLSLDLDDPYRLRPLSYRWSCSYLYPTYTSGCPLGTILTSPTLSFSPGSLIVGTVIVTVYVSNSVGIQSSTSSQLNIISGLIPNVGIMDNMPYVNANQKNYLTAIVSGNQGAILASWSSPQFSTLGSIATTEVSENFNGSSIFTLGIPAFALYPGQTYTFSVSASYAQQQTVASASIIIYVNSGPSGGILNISPTFGIAMNTSFFFNTFSWISDISNLPLSYQLLYYITDNSIQYPLKYSDAVPYVTTVLSEGSMSRSYAVIGVAVVTDSVGAVANTTASVTVQPNLNIFDLGPNIRKLLATALDQNQPYAVTQISNAASISLNSINCSVPQPCQLLNRIACTDVSNTCGSCLSGFIGDDGSSNNPCVSINSLSRRLLTSNHRSRGLLTSGSKDCITNSTCLSRICIDRKCVESNKLCPANCQGSGVCRYVNNFGVSISSCAMSNYYCNAVCVCYAGYFGSDCSLSISSSQSSIDIRQQLCASMLKTVPQQDVSSFEVTSRANVIANIAADPSQLSFSALSDCVSLLHNTIVNRGAMICQKGIHNSVFSSLSTLISRRWNLQSDTIANKLLSSIMVVSLACQKTMIRGEKPLTVYKNNLRLITTTNEYQQANNMYKLPSSTYAAYENVSTVKLVLDNSFFSTKVEKLGLSILDLSTNIMNSNSNTTTVFMSLVNYGSRAGSVLQSTNTEIKYSVAIPNINPSTYLTSPVEYHTIFCGRMSRVVYPVNVFCVSDSAVHNFACPANKRGVLNVTCPVFSTKPVCLLSTSTSGSFSGEYNKSCSAIAYTSRTTTCSCSFPPLSTQWNISFQFVTVSYLATTKATTSIFIEESSVASNETDFGVILLVSVIYILFLIQSSLTAMWTRRALTSRVDPLFISNIRNIQSFYDSIKIEDLTFSSWREVFWKRWIIESIFSFAYNPISETSLINQSTTFFQDIYKIELSILAVGRLISFLFCASVIAFVYLLDDGSCSQYKSSSSCEQSQVYFSFGRKCQWNTSKKSCSHRIENFDFHTVFWFTTVTILGSILLNRVLEMHLSIFKRLFIAPVVKKRQPKRNVHQFDQFSAVQSRKTKFLLAARLTKIIQTFEFLSSKEEASIINQNQPLLRANNAVSLDSNFLKQFPRITEGEIHRSRETASAMQRDLFYLTFDEDKEAFLIKSFIIEILPAYCQSTAVYALFGGPLDLNYVSEKPSNAFMDNVLKIITCVYLLGHFFGFSYFIFRVGVDIGSSGTGIFITSFAASILVDTFFVKPFHVILKWILWIYFFVGKKISHILTRLKQRSKLILIRTGGIMRGAYSVIQHVNPACRVAREFPFLPLARLLMSLSDNDIAIGNDWTNSKTLLAFFQVISFVPLWVMDTILDWCGAGVALCLIYALSILYSESLWAFVVVAAVLVLAATIFVTYDLLFKPLLSGSIIDGGGDRSERYKPSPEDNDIPEFEVKEKFNKSKTGSVSKRDFTESKRVDYSEPQFFFPTDSVATAGSYEEAKINYPMVNYVDFNNNNVDLQKPKSTTPPSVSNTPKFFMDLDQSPANSGAVQIDADIALLFDDKPTPAAILAESLRPSHSQTLQPSLSKLQRSPPKGIRKDRPNRRKKKDQIPPPTISDKLPSTFPLEGLTTLGQMKISPRTRRRSDRKRDTRDQENGPGATAAESAERATAISATFTGAADIQAANIRMPAEVEVGATVVAPGASGVVGNDATNGGLKKSSNGMNFADLLMVNSEGPLPSIDFLAGIDSSIAGNKGGRSNGPGSRFAAESGDSGATKPPAPVSDEEAKKMFNLSKASYPLFSD